MESVKTVTATDSTPDEIVNNMHTLYSDSGIVKFEIIATRMEKFNGDEETTIFKDGFEVNFFKGKDEIEAKLTAEYGEMKKNEKTIIARNNVIFINYIEDQTLRTEELTWYQTTKRIKTNKQFQLWDRKKNYYALGSDMESDETFRDYILHNVTVEHEIKDEDNGLD